MNVRESTREVCLKASPPRRQRPPKSGPLRELPPHPHAEKICDFLPYGEYRSRDGTRVVHDQFYRPIWRLKPDGEIEGVNPAEWIPHSWHDIFRDRHDRLDWKALDRVKAAWRIRSW
jgi:hypothetical protein